MLTELPVTKQVTLRVVFKDKKGNPSRVDGVPAWSTDNTDVLALEPAADGLSCVVKPVGPLTETATTITLSADADMGAGLRPISGTFLIEKLTAGDAEIIELTAGPLTDQP